MKIIVKENSVGSSYFFRKLEYIARKNFTELKECPACHAEFRDSELSNLYAESFPEQRLTLVGCAVCGHATYKQLPFESDLADFYTKGWDRNTNEQNPSKIKIRSNEKSKWSYASYLNDLKPIRSARILDFGCGRGEGLLYLQKQGYSNISGVEIGEIRAKIARNNLKCTIVTGTIEAAESLAKTHGKFDLILVNHVAEHLLFPRETIGRLINLLECDGQIAISVPYPFSESPVHLPLYFPHLHHYTPQSLQAIFSSFGQNAALWSGSKIQMAVVGSKNLLENKWFIPIVPQQNQKSHIVKLKAFLKRPYIGSAGECTLNYFHPWVSSIKDGGFKKINTMGVFLICARNWVLNKLESHREASYSGWRQLLRVANKVLNSNQTKRIAVGGDAIQISIEDDGSETLSFVMRGSDIMVLDK